MNNSQESINIRFLLWRDGMPASGWSKILREKLRWDLREIENFLKGGSVNFQQLQDLSDSFDRLDEELATDDLLSQEGTDIVCENLRALFKDMEHGEKKKIAEHLGVEAATVSRWLSGKHHPPAETLKVIAAHFGLSRAIDLTVTPLFLEIEPFSILSQKNWLYRNIERMSNDEVRELFPALKRLLS